MKRGPGTLTPLSFNDQPAMRHRLTSTSAFSPFDFIDLNIQQFKVEESNVAGDRIRGLLTSVAGESRTSPNSPMRCPVCSHAGDRSRS